MSTPPPKQIREEAAEHHPPPPPEEGECGFCLFMKGGGCKDVFVSWDKCVKEAENNDEDHREKCAQVVAALKKCMFAHADYYGPILGVEEQTLAELENDQENENENENVPPPSN